MGKLIEQLYWPPEPPAERELEDGLIATPADPHRWKPASAVVQEAKDAARLDCEGVFDLIGAVRARFKCFDSLSLLVPPTL